MIWHGMDSVWVKSDGNQSKTFIFIQFATEIITSSKNFTVIYIENLSPRYTFLTSSFPIISFGSPSSTSSNDQQPMQANPILRYYETWSSTTPAVTRLSTMALIVVYGISWIFDLVMYLGNNVLYTLYSFEL